MNDALELLRNINWFLDPIKDFLVFLFTTKAGFWLLLIAFLAYMFIPAADALKSRRLAYKAAAGFSTGRMTIAEKIYLVAKSFTRSLSKIISNIPVLIISFLLLFFIVAVSSGITAVDDYVQNRKKIDELQTVLKQLDQRYKVAEMEILDYNYYSDSTTLELRFYDEALGSLSEKMQKIEIAGNDIYFDAVILNFDFSHIADQQKRNLVLPYRLFSNKVPQAEGHVLNLTDSSGVPLIYKRKNDDIFGLSPDAYNARLNEFVKFMNNEEAAREAGIRSSYGNAVHRRVRKGQTLTVWVEQTGGLVIKEKQDF
jgi:archaellum component FlaF (FlaF/FlaG flagellin family)